VTEPWVSVDEVAAHLGVRKDSIYRWIEHRGLPARKIGKLWKLKLSEVDAWVRNGDAADAGPAPPATPAQRRGAAEKALILVIDDERLVRETVSDFLTDAGYGVLLASDGAEALALLAATAPRPALILLDLKMPNLDGWKFREQQLRDPAFASIPVIVVTADSNASVNGAAAILRKPLRLQQLAKAMSTVLHHEAELLPPS
jgi:excisionase family DNA binding protein